MLDMQDKENEYNFWRMSIPIKKNPKTVNFLFTKVDECLQNFLTPTMLKMHQDEMNQSVYYIANLVDLESIEILDEENVTLLHDDIDTPQTTLKQMIKFVEFQNIKEIWSISVGNSSKVKHYVILLQNNGHICSCLSILRCGIVCRHYFQVMLATSNAMFHIRLIPTRWYNGERNGSNELFIFADKYMQEQLIITSDYHDAVPYLCSIKDYREESLSFLEQKIAYGKLHSAYKKALKKALQTDFNSQNLINLLEEFAENDNIDEQSESDEYEDDINDKENVNPTLLKNPKPHRGNGRPMGTKRIKSAHEILNQRTKHQRRCKKCGNIGHYQKNCKIQRTSEQ
ncbi:unnamed protein product [Rhizophagus irregularis]|nr:unnamed protein product [Rhizophagus irregularis]